jgi:putative Mg2+ transporter-C (MgtC) family protein
MTHYPYEFELLLRICLAVICGSLLGYERERHGISAGLRTNLLVCTGSALIMIISKYFFYIGGETASNIPVALDPARIAAQIVTGIGFLGAGVIIKDKGAVRGLTTAATLWFNAGVGMSLGAGMLVIPISCTIIAFIALDVLKKLPFKIHRELYKDILVSCTETGDDHLPVMTEFFRSKNLTLDNIDLSKIKQGVSTYKFTIKCDRSCTDIVYTIHELSMFSFITKIKVN